MTVRVKLKFVVLAFALLATGCYNTALDFKQMVGNYRSIEAGVVHLDCANHGAVYYAFWVETREFRGKAPSGIFDCRATKIGEKRLVYYLPTNPNIHSFYVPNEAYARAYGWYIPEWWWFTVLPLLFICIVAITEVSRGKKRA